MVITFDKMLKDVVEQYKQDMKVFADEDFFLDNTVDNILNRYWIFNDFELARKLVKEAAKVIGNEVKIFSE